MYFCAGLTVYATPRHFWRVVSPDHEQTFSDGTETRRVWAERNHHLALLLDFTNDPHVDRQNPRQYDSFTFAFPQVVLARDGKTFVYPVAGGRTVPVARREPDALGVAEIHLLPNATLDLQSHHGLLELTLILAASTNRNQ